LFKVVSMPSSPDSKILVEEFHWVVVPLLILILDAILYNHGLSKLLKVFIVIL